MRPFKGILARSPAVPPSRSPPYSTPHAYALSQSFITGSKPNA